MRRTLFESLTLRPYTEKPAPLADPQVEHMAAELSARTRKRLGRSLSLRLVQLTARLTELTGGRVEARFARFFLKLAGEIGRRDRGGIFIPLPFSRQELADWTGTTVETSIRIMSRWNKEDVLRTERDGFVLVDRETLETLAGS